MNEFCVVSKYWHRQYFDKLKMSSDWNIPQENIVSIYK